MRWSTVLATKPSLVRDTVFLSGGPYYNIPLGRRDGLNFATINETLANIPAPTADTTALLTSLATKGFDTTDVVALSGGHTIGIANCGSFVGRIIPTQDPTLNETFAIDLRNTCPTNVTSNTTFLDVLSPNAFDNSYYADLMNRRGLFTSDQDLFTDNRTRDIVTSFAANQTLFFENFVIAMIKMGQLSVLTDTQGEIRANCSVTNAGNMCGFMFVNVLLMIVFTIIENLRALIHGACNQTVSCSDITALAARDAVFLSGGPDYNIPLGRRDGLDFATRNETLANLPAPFANTTTLLTSLATKGFDTTDVVALSGGHTIGIANCGSFVGRIIPTQDPTLNETFAIDLRNTCPTNVTSNTTFMDVLSPNAFDNSYYADLMNRRGLFTSDQDLFTDNRTRDIVTSFAANQTLFFENFVIAMIKMGQLSVLTGTQGEIRANCSVTNAGNMCGFMFVNVLLMIVFTIIENLRALIHGACNQTVSCSDITALAARDAVFLSGGPDYNIPLGRRDGLDFATRNETLANLPAPFANTTTLLTSLATKGFDTTDVVALSGGHTIGIANCGSFVGRIIPTQDPTLNETFANDLRNTCPTNVTSNTTVMDVLSPNVFDNSYYVDLMNRQGLFTSDQDLFTDNRTRGIVTSFAANQTLFFENFVIAMIKMGQLNVLTGTQGEIRANCSLTNASNLLITTGMESKDDEMLASY
ncbi:hypothetical protein LXL04_030062 [Taraxacum kok-saghyz]